MKVILVQDSCVVMKVYTLSNLQNEQFDRKTGYIHFGKFEICEI